MRLRPLGHSHKPWRELQWQTFPFGVAGSNSNGNGVSKRGALVVKPPTCLDGGGLVGALTRFEQLQGLAEVQRFHCCSEFVDLVTSPVLNQTAFNLIEKIQCR